MKDFALMCSAIFLSIGIVLCLWRALHGPSLFDRILAFDCMVLHTLGLMLNYSIVKQTVVYLDVLIVVGLLGFVGTISLALYQEGKIVD